MTEKTYLSQCFDLIRVIPLVARDYRVPDKRGSTVLSSVTDLLLIPDELFFFPYAFN